MVACCCSVHRSIAGAAICSESRKQLIRRFAAAAVIAEQMEAKLARGEDISITDHAITPIGT
jgi:hypothetical protein